jgi:HlyD family secretion protein
MWFGSADELKIQASSLFRKDEGWSIFVVDNGKVRQQDVKIWQRNSDEAEIIEGITAGSEIVIDPTNDLTDGTFVEVRNSEQK